MFSSGSLRSRILLSYTLMTMGLLIVIGLVSQIRTRLIIEEDFATTCKTVGELIVRQSISPIFTEDREAMDTVASQALAIPALVGIGFFDELDQPLFVRFSLDQVPAVPLSSQPMDLWTDTSTLFHLVEPVSMSFFDPQTNRPGSPRAVGKLRLRFSRTEVNRQLSAMRFNLAFDLLLFTLSFSLLIILLEKWVTRPLSGMIEKIQSIAKGEFATRLEVPADQGEITALCESINHMATSLDRYTFHLQTTIEEKTREIAQRERQMMFQEKMASLGRISASIAHEINNPLNFINLGVEFLEQGHRNWLKGVHSDPVEVGGVLQDIRHGVQRTRTIIDALRSFARTDEDVKNPYRLDEAVETAIRMQGHDLRTWGIKTDVQCSFTSTINGSEMRVQQILINLIGNAIDVLRDHKVSAPRIGIRLWKSSGEAHLAVDDNGPGIPDGIRARLFEPFFTTKPPGKGTGLGLALCFEFANREGGRIFLAEPVLGGATFELVLPVNRGR